VVNSVAVFFDLFFYLWSIDIVFLRWNIISNSRGSRYVVAGHHYALRNHLIKCDKLSTDTSVILFVSAISIRPQKFVTSLVLRTALTVANKLDIVIYSQTIRFESLVTN